LRVAEVEAIVVKRLRYLGRNAPHLLRYPMLVVASQGRKPSAGAPATLRDEVSASRRMKPRLPGQ